jgi:hypothetical protein
MSVRKSRLQNNHLFSDVNFPPQTVGKNIQLVSFLAAAATSQQASE